MEIVVASGGASHTLLPVVLSSSTGSAVLRRQNLNLTVSYISFLSYLVQLAMSSPCLKSRQETSF